MVMSPMHIMYHLQVLHLICQLPTHCIQAHLCTEYGQEHLSMRVALPGDPDLSFRSGF